MKFKTHSLISFGFGCLLIVVFASSTNAAKTTVIDNSEIQISTIKIEKIEKEPEPEQEVVSEKGEPSEELVRQAWESSATNKPEKLQEVVNKCIELYGNEANIQQEQLTNFPERGKEKSFQSLNDVATILFVEAEFLMNRGKKEDAIAKFQHIIDKYKWAQAWDPRGWYWSVAEKSSDSIDVLTGKYEDEVEQNRKKVIQTKPKLHTPGTDQVVDYTKYGSFLNVGTEEYKYSISDIQGLAKAVGEGIYPNTSSIYNNPHFKKVKKEGRLKGTHWDYVNTDDLEAAYFKWATAPEPWGVKLFYVGLILEKSGLIHEAIKAYHSLVVHFPKTVAYTYWQTPWYPAQAATAKIRHLVRIHPEIGLYDKYMKVYVKNGFDNTAENDKFITFPGKILHKGMVDKLKDSWDEGMEELGKPIAKRGKGKVHLLKYKNNHWQLIVDGKPFIIKGMNYSPTKIGQSPDKGTLKNWMEEDGNNNGKIDGPYDSWVDKNGNHKRDEDEPIVGDFQLMKEMGVNTLRIYHNPETPNKEVLRQMYEQFGIRVIMSDFLGKYSIGSGATWAEGTDYENPVHRQNMMEQVKKMVMEHKDEPYILFWLLGNENNYGVACNADKKPKAYFEFANEVALWIKEVDKHHPVAVSNGDTLFLDVFAEVAPDIDIFGANIYRGDYGFGSFWEQVSETADRPAFITEYGAPAYAAHLTLKEADQAQADYHKGNWLDIAENTAGHKLGIGNALGGVAFEWLDEWWKNYEPYRHDRKSDAVGPFPGGYYFEEWFGIISQGNGQDSPYLRQLRPAYFVYKELWNK